MTVEKEAFITILKYHLMLSCYQEATSLCYLRQENRQRPSPSSSLPFLVVQPLAQNNGLFPPIKLNWVEKDKATHSQIGKYQMNYSTPTPQACSSFFTLAHQVANTQTLDCPHHSAYTALVSEVA